MEQQRAAERERQAAQEKQREAEERYEIILKNEATRLQTNETVERQTTFLQQSHQKVNLPTNVFFRKTPH